MQTKKMTIVTVVAGLILVLVVGLGAAQKVGLAAGPPPRGPASVGTMVQGRIPIQGRLTDASGSPLNGDYSITFRIYDDDTDGTVLCQDTQTVSVSNGLFSTAIDGCTPSDIDGTQVYLGIQVKSDGEMTPRQPIYSVPYAMSLVPGADFRGALSGQPMFTVENKSSEWSTAISGYASATSGENYGVEGRSNSTNGYGGYFLNSNGVALKASGTGIIQSTADTEIAVSPLKMVAQYDSDVEFRSDGAYMEVRPNATGLQYVQVPVDLPTVLFGTATKLKSVRICYRCDQAASYITTTFVRYATDSGTLSTLITDNTDRTSTSWECYTFTDTTPDEIQGSLWIALSLYFAGTGSSHDIRIGNTTLTLTEE